MIVNKDVVEFHRRHPATPTVTLALDFYEQLLETAEAYHQRLDARMPQAAEDARCDLSHLKNQLTGQREEIQVLKDERALALHDLSTAQAQVTMLEEMVRGRGDEIKRLRDLVTHHEGVIARDSDDIHAEQEKRRILQEDLDKYKALHQKQEEHIARLQQSVADERDLRTKCEAQAMESKHEVERLLTLHQKERAEVHEVEVEQLRKTLANTREASASMAEVNRRLRDELGELRVKARKAGR